MASKVTSEDVYVVVQRIMHATRSPFIDKKGTIQDLEKHLISIVHDTVKTHAESRRLVYDPDHVAVTDDFKEVFVFYPPKGDMTFNEMCLEYEVTSPAYKPCSPPPSPAGCSPSYDAAQSYDPTEPK